jgi:hypothetical protein
MTRALARPPEARRTIASNDIALAGRSSEPGRIGRDRQLATAICAKKKGGVILRLSNPADRDGQVGTMPESVVVSDLTMLPQAIEGMWRSAANMAPDLMDYGVTERDAIRSCSHHDAYLTVRAWYPNHHHRAPQSSAWHPCTRGCSGSFSLAQGLEARSRRDRSG